MKNIYRKLFNKMNIGYGHFKIIFKDKKPFDYEILDINDSCITFLGIKEDEIISKTIRTLIDDEKNEHFNWIGFYGEIASSNNRNVIETVYQYSEELDSWYKIFVYSPKKNYIILNFIDIGLHMKNTNNKLMELENVFTLLLDTIPTKMFWKDKNSKYIGANDLFLKAAGLENIGEIFGKQDDDMIWKNLADIYRKEDLNIIESGKAIVNREIKTLDIDGNIIWEKYNKLPLINKDGEVFGLIGIIEDITEIKGKQIEIEKIKNRYEDLAIKSGTVIWEIDLNLRFKYLNNTIEKILGYKKEELINKKYIYDLFDEKEKEEVRDLLIKKIERKENLTDYENISISKDGKSIYFLTNGMIVYDEKNNVKAYKGISIDVTYLKELEKKNIYLSFHDQLTGLYNRRYFEEQLKRIDTSRNLPLSLIMIDANGLKLVNDALGHKRGDEFLKIIAQALRENCRKEDIIARVGGDEFVIILPKTDENTGKSIISRIEKNIKNKTINGIPISVATGIETKNNMEKDVETLYKVAENHMYKKKSSEREGLRHDTIEKIMENIKADIKGEAEYLEDFKKVAYILGKELNLTSSQFEKLIMASKYHNIGKIALDKDILNYEGEICEDKIEEINRHPEISYNILSTTNEYAGIAESVLYHHENWDGSGHPKGLKGKEIPIIARVLWIIEFYISLKSKRPYKENLVDKNFIIERLIYERGKKFEPKLVDILVALISLDKINR